MDISPEDLALILFGLFVGCATFIVAVSLFVYVVRTTRK